MTDTIDSNPQVEVQTRYSLLPLRDVVVFPHMVIPLFVGRVKSINALDNAMSAGKQVFLAAQHDASDDDPRGVVCRLLALAAERNAVELEARARSSGDLVAYQPSIAFLRRGIIDLRETVADLDQVEPLFQWLIDYSEGGIDS